MDKHLRPTRFSAEANTNTSEREWKHWFRTFTNFLTTIEAQNPDKLNTLINYCMSLQRSLSTLQILFHIKMQDTLKGMYVKQKNEIYNHVLASRTQNETESLDEFIQELTTAKNVHLLTLVVLSIVVSLYVVLSSTESVHEKSDNAYSRMPHLQRMKLSDRLEHWRWHRNNLHHITRANL